MKNSIEEIQNLEKSANENEHIIQMWEPLKFNIDEQYKYVPKSKLFNLFSNFVYYIIAYPILKIITKLIYDLKIEGKENIRKIESGAVTVSNHVLILDCAMVGLASGKKKIYYTTTEDSFKIPFVRKLIKLLRAIPIPKSIKNKEYFIKSINQLLQENKLVHFYPERSLFPYYEKIRHFKNGAFTIAVKNNVPVIPMVFTFRNPKGIRKIFKRKKDVTLTILKPVYPEKENLDNKLKVQKLKEETYSQMVS